MENPLIKNLQNPKLYNHEVKKFHVIDTHISWILLTGTYAYKIKKPVDFGFLNYTDLTKRKFFCEEELRLNQILAPHIYLEVVTITNSAENPQINGDGPVIEYALKMREFSQDKLFNKLQQENKLTMTQIEKAAEILAQFHEKTSKDTPAYFGTASHVHEPAQQNFDQIRELLDDPMDIERLNRLEVWENEQYAKLKDVFKKRRELGFVRECHGDVHLGNITMINDAPTIFDCIEFNESLRWTDTMADLGFLIMDLHDYKEEQFANRVLNTYLSISGDYAGLKVLTYYQAYRAMVRAKVNLFDLTYSNNTEDKNITLKGRYNGFISLAERYATQYKPSLIITHGLSGSGKSTISQIIADNLGVIHVRSDVERKRLAGLQKGAKSYSAINQNLYHPDITEKTYSKLLTLAKTIIDANYTVIIDATFLKQKQRQLFKEFAQNTHIPFIILYCQASTEDLTHWIELRQKNSQEISEATLEVLKMQQQTQEPLSESESQFAIELDASSKNLNIISLLEEIKNRIQYPPRNLSSF